MSKTSTQLLSQKKKTMPTKLVMGLLVATVSVLVGTAGIAAATPGNNGHGHAYGHGRGVGNGNGHGHGYGGVNIDLGGIVGDNNVIIIIINYFMGR